MGFSSAFQIFVMPREAAVWNQNYLAYKAAFVGAGIIVRPVESARGLDALQDAARTRGGGVVAPAFWSAVA